MLTLNYECSFSGEFLYGVGDGSSILQCNLRDGQLLSAAVHFNAVSEKLENTKFRLYMTCCI